MHGNAALRPVLYIILCLFIFAACEYTKDTGPLVTVWDEEPVDTTTSDGGEIDTTLGDTSSYSPFTNFELYGFYTNTTGSDPKFEFDYYTRTDQEVNFFEVYSNTMTDSPFVQIQFEKLGIGNQFANYIINDIIYHIDRDRNDFFVPDSEARVETNIVTTANIVLVLDHSLSLGKIGGGIAKKIAEGFLETQDGLPDSTKFGLVLFSTEQERFEIGSNVHEMLDAIQDVEIGELTTYYDATIAAANMLYWSEADEKILIAITDGKDNQSTRQIEDVISYLQFVDIKNYTIACLEPNERVMRDLAINGSYHYSPDVLSLCNTITRDIVTLYDVNVQRGNVIVEDAIPTKLVISAQANFGVKENYPVANGGHW